MSASVETSSFVVARQKLCLAGFFVQKSEEIMSWQDRLAGSFLTYLVLTEHSKSYKVEDVSN